MGLPVEYLGVHVRHGDSCTALHAHTQEGQAMSRGYLEASPENLDSEGKDLEKRCAALPAFAHAISSLSDSLGITSVYLATDNPEALPLLQQLLPHVRFYINSQVHASVGVGVAPVAHTGSSWQDPWLTRCALCIWCRHNRSCRSTESS
jgi:hypothetical protein